MSTQKQRKHRERFGETDSGIAMVASITITALLATLAIVAIGVAAMNLQTSGSDRQAASAMTVSESGIAQAVSYVRTHGVAKLKCAPNCGTANPWGESGDDGDADPPMRITVNVNEHYDVWFETLQPMNAVGKRPGVYKVVSVGTSNPGPGSRRVEVEIEVSPFDFPVGVFAQSVDGGGNPGLHYVSMFSTGCISNRDAINFSPVADAAYGFPASAHSSGVITKTNNKFACGAGDSGAIHNTKTCPVSYKFDEDALESDCYGTFAGPPAYTLERITSATKLAEKYGFNLDAFTDAELEMLKQQSIEQGLYFTNTTGIPARLVNGEISLSHPILFYELTGSAVGGEVDLKHISDDPARGWGRAGGTTDPIDVTDVRCSGRSAIVIVKNGNVKLNSNSRLNASVFALGPGPNYGKVSKANGTSQLFGTLYGTNIDMTGTADIRMDQCALESMAGFLSIDVKNFREVDR